VHRCFAEERSPALLNWDTARGQELLDPRARDHRIRVLPQPGQPAPARRLDYDTDFDSFERNLKTSPVYDKDPFSVNQIGHPYQGGILLRLRTLGRTPVLESLLYTLAGQLSLGDVRRDHAALDSTTTSPHHRRLFVGEALFRMAGLLLEGGGERPGSGGSSAPR